MEGDRRSRILGGISGDARSVTIALVSTVVFFAVLVFVIGVLLRRSRPGVGTR